MKRQEWLVWTYPLIALLLVLAFVPAIREWHRVDDEARARSFAELRPITPVQLDRLLTRTEKRMKEPLSKGPAEYYHILQRVWRGEDYANKLSRESDWTQPIQVLALRANGLFNAMNTLQVTYMDKFTMEVMAAEGKKHHAKHVTDGKSYPDLTFAKAGQLFVTGYINSILIMAMCFVVRLRRRELMVWVEGWRLPALAVAWPVTMWRYPTVIDPRTQMRHAMQFASYLLATVMSLGALGGVAKAAERKDAPERDSAHSLVLSRIPQPKFSVAIGIEGSKVVGNGKRVFDGPIITGTGDIVFPNGVFLEFWGSKAQDGSPLADEVDYTLGWSGIISHGINLAAGVSYFDIGEIGTTKGGDIVDLFAQVNTPQLTSGGHKVGAFMKVEKLFVTDTSRELDGMNVRGGYEYVWQVTDHVRLGHSASMFYAKGPFGADDGVGMRFDATMSVQVTEHVSVTPIALKAFVPISGMEDRGVVHSLGSGVSYSFN